MPKVAARRLKPEHRLEDNFAEVYFSQANQGGAYVVGFDSARYGMALGLRGAGGSCGGPNPRVEAFDNTKKRVVSKIS